MINNFDLISMFVCFFCSATNEQLLKPIPVQYSIGVYYFELIFEQKRLF